MELCYDSACTRYKKPMTPAGVQGKDGVTRSRPTCAGTVISNGLRWPVVRALITKANIHRVRIMNGSQSLRHVDRLADLMGQAQAAARNLPVEKFTHNKPKKG